MSVKMAHLQIVGLKSQLMPALHTVRQLGCLHIDKVTESPETPLPPLSVDATIVGVKEELQMGLLQVNGLLDALQVGDAYQPGATVEGAPAEWVAEVGAIMSRVQTLTASRDKLRGEQELLPRFEETMRKFLPILPALAHDPDYASFGLLVNRMHADVLTIVQKHVIELTEGTAEILIGEIDEATQGMLVVAPMRFAGEVSGLLDRHDVARLRLPSEVDSTSPDAAIVSLRRRLKEIPTQLSGIEQELARLASKYAPKLLLWRELLMDELDTYETMTKLGETAMTFTIVGWVPADRFDRITTVLRESCGEEVLVNRLPLTPEAKARTPVSLANPSPARPFETLVGLFGIPPYEGIDPTCLMALFMPVFFGMMLGDAGYGALLLGAALWLRSRFRDRVRRDLTAVVAIGAVWAIVFGILYGEVFGTLGVHLGLHPLLFDRADPQHLFDLLILTISIGAMHILLGLVLGIYEGIRERSRNHLLERGGRLLGMIALFLSVGIVTDFLPDGFMTPGIAALIVGIVLLAIPYGKVGIIVAPIEMIGVFGNVLSYVRIAAIGLASVYLALVANELAGAVGGIVVGIIVAVLLHALNLALGTLSPTIQGLRLHYFEFFRNFYHGGGRPYQPFRSGSGAQRK